MSEYDLTPAPKPNMFLCDRKTLSVSKRNISKTIRHYESDILQSTDKKFIKARQEKVELLKMIRKDLKELLDQL